MGKYDKNLPLKIILEFNSDALKLAYNLFIAVAILYAFLIDIWIYFVFIFIICVIAIFLEYFLSTLFNAF